MPRLLSLRNLGDDEDGEPTVYSGCAPFAQKTVQNAGKSFWDRFERKGGSSDGESKDEADSPRSNDEEDRQTGSTPSPKKKKEKKEREEALKLPECLKGEDLYELLEVDVGCSQDDLKKAFRKVCLTHHPDKHGDKTGADLEAVNLHFVKLQEAFNIVSDIKKRRKYDSMGTFDDWTPTKLKEGQDFFEVFAPVFKLNSKWSEVKPVPELGKPDASYEKVKPFYDFWFDFQSWRSMDELIMEEEGEDCFQDLEDAECREEKRWMERENARVRGKYMKIERQRIFAFVELAEKLDPRVRAYKDEQHALKEAAKNAKEAKRLELERLAQEEAERKEAAEEQARLLRAEEKVKREEEKQVKKVARANLRKVVKPLNLSIAEESLQEFLLVLEPVEAQKLSEQIASGKGEAKGEAVLAAFKAKGIEPIIVKALPEDEKSTEEGSPSEEEEPKDPKEIKRLEKERLEKQKEQEKRRKVEEAKLKKVREEEAAKRAVEKEAKDAKKKVEQEKKEKEQQKQLKKQQEQEKRAEEKRVKDEEKAVEKARLAKEADAKRSQEQREKQKAENQAEMEEKELERRTFEFERDRLARCEDFDKLAWAAVIEAAQAASEDPIIASGLAAAEAEYEDAEELLDVQLSCLGSFFALGARPPVDAYALSSGLRSRVKKLRSKVRTAAEKGELTLSPPEGTEADSDALAQLLLAAAGEAPAATAAVEEVVAEEAPAAGKAGKKKAKAKAAPEDEDLDALLQEFGVTVTEKKKKGSKKK